MRCDIAIVGAGHNGLVAAIRLAEAGLSVRMFEAAEVIGGAARTEHPFEHAPDVGQSTGAYLLGLMPPEVLAACGVEIPTIRRDPHYFLPLREDGYLLFGSDREATDRQFRTFFSEQDLTADRALQSELAALREDVGPAWLHAPLSIEETAERYVRPSLREAFVDLCRGTIGDYLDRFGFESELLPAMYAVTDAFTGSHCTFDTPGSGMNFLIHNMCRLPGSDGTWMIVRGGMGTVTRRLGERARELGVQIETGCQVAAIESSGGCVTGVALDDGRTVAASAVVSNADPFRTAQLCGDALPSSFSDWLATVRRPGLTLKLNLCLSDLPRFACLPEARGQHGATIHLLPAADRVRSTLNQAYADATAGRLPNEPSIEWYIHTPLDPSLSDDRGRHSSALFVQWVPNRIEGSSWEAEGEAFADRLLAICDEFAPGTSDLVVDHQILHPQAIEEHFGITGGHIHHVDNIFGFDERLPYSLPLDGLFACGAGCHPGGSVIGAAGYIAADVVRQALDASSDGPSSDRTL